MEIVREETVDRLVIKVKGRLDAYWADHLESVLNEVIREGSHHIGLNLSGVDYLSSAGIGILVGIYGKLKDINGSFLILEPSERVKEVVQLVRLESLLSVPPEAARTAAAGAELVRTLETKNADFEVYEDSPGASLDCRVLGDPEMLQEGGYAERDCQCLAFPKSTFGVGLGAFGNSFEDCRTRFGEFLALGGAAAYLPTGDTNVPDYLLATGTFIPEVQVLYALACQGAFAHLTRFESKKEMAVLPLDELIQTCMDLTGSDMVGIAMVAESAGLVGATLKRSPAAEGISAKPFGHPQVREWLSFTAERAHVQALTVVAGVAARTQKDGLAPLLRPLGRDGGLSGHFHGAVFSYRPLEKGKIELETTVRTLFEGEALLNVLHLLNDRREITGAGQSEFVRGACWVSPVTKVTLG